MLIVDANYKRIGLSLSPFDLRILSTYILGTPLDIWVFCKLTWLSRYDIGNTWAVGGFGRV